MFSPEFDLKTVLGHLNQLQPELVVDTPLPELEQTLSNLLQSGGQSLHAQPAGQVTASPAAYLQRFRATYLPFYTMCDFPHVSPVQVRILALGATCLYLYAICLDEVVDEPQTASISVKMAIQHLLFRAFRFLSTLFAPASSFWSEFENRLRLTSQAILQEHDRHRGRVGPFSFNEFKQLAQDKMILAQMNGIGLSILNKTPEHIPILTGCWNALMFATVIHDDIVDWPEDYRNANYTYLLSQVLLSPPFRANVEAGNLPELAEVGAALFCTDIIEKLYITACQHLDDASNQAATINHLALARLIRLTQAALCAKPAQLFERKMAALIEIKKNNLGPLSAQETF